jgi:hypothetical protein
MEDHMTKYEFRWFRSTTGRFLLSLRPLLHGGLCAACREVHTNVADESAFQTADNVRNEVVIDSAM